MGDQNVAKMAMLTLRKFVYPIIVLIIWVLIYIISSHWDNTQTKYIRYLKRLSDSVFLLECLPIYPTLIPYYLYDDMLLVELFLPACCYQMYLQYVSTVKKLFQQNN